MPKKRKIGFYNLKFNENNTYTGIEAFDEVVNFIIGRNLVDRRLDLGDNKFCFLDSCTIDQSGNYKKIVFKSAVHKYRPNLIDKDTIAERINPKQIHEGECEKTHITIKITDDELVFLMEKHINGVLVSQFVKYLNYFVRQLGDQDILNVGYEILVKDDFLQEINNLNRVSSAEIIVDKQLLGGNALNFSNRIEEVKHEVKITVKANRLDSIADFARDTFALINGGENQIQKIKIIGRNEDNNEVVLKTDFIEKQEYITTDINDETGEILTEQFFSEMINILQN